MKRVIVYIYIGWLLCGIHNWGVALGDFGTQFPPTRDHYGFALFMGVMGPFGVIPAICASNLYEQGFLWK